jgi:ABC transport system ATP-binding/permease protein
MRLMMEGPNVLVLDEPTNDLDIDTLTALEDLLDGWPGTLVVVSHDRYFVERVCDDVHALGADGTLRHLPGGIDQYVQARREEHAPAPVAPRRDGPAPGAVLRATRKEVARVERAIEKLAEREAALQVQMAASVTDHARLAQLDAELRDRVAERERLEGEWLELSEALEA